MAPPPVERNGEGGGGESTAVDAPRSLPTPFLTKTYQIVEDEAINDIISWNEDGSAFIVWNPTEFARDLLPKYFKHNNFSSFVRQLNTYGFRKVVPDRWEFANDCFRKGKKKLLCDIQRRKIVAAATVTETTSAAVVAVAVQQCPPVAPPVPPMSVSPSESGEEQVISSSNSLAPAREFAGNAAELIGENERLRKENVQLNKELSQMKNLCNNIYVMMSCFAGSNSNTNNSSNDQNGDSCKSDLAENVVRPLDLLPMTKFCEEMKAAAATAAEKGGVDISIRSAAEEINARLFGVRIGVKRGREGEGSSTDNEIDLQLQQPGGDNDMISEPLDQENRSNDPKSSWSTRSNSKNQKVCD